MRGLASEAWGFQGFKLLPVDCRFPLSNPSNPAYVRLVHYISNLTL
jgi:hypothetical protein